MLRMTEMKGKSVPQISRMTLSFREAEVGSSLPLILVAPNTSEAILSFREGGDWKPRGRALSSITTKRE